MKRAGFERLRAYGNELVDAVTDLLNVRFPGLVRDAVEREFSGDPPIALHANDAPNLKFERPIVQVSAEGVLDAARERAVLYVARAVAERLAAGDAEKWRAGRRQIVRRAQFEFDQYVRENREKVAQRERLTRIKRGSAASPARSAAAEALRRRIAAIRLPPRIQ